jgi:MYXO-CTERM domain-containing protein
MRTRTALFSTVALTLAAGSASAAVTVSAVHETQKIRPTDPPPASSSSIALSCAENEFCAFQIAVSASGAAATVSGLSVADLTGPSGKTLTGSSALVYREGFLDIATTSNSAGATGEWPDPLIPDVDAFYGETRNAFPSAVAAGQTQAFWVELHVPADQIAGTYAGTVTIKDSDGTSQSVALSIRVRAFALPSTSSLASVYGFGWDGPCIGHFGGYGPPNCDDAQLEALNALYFQDALNHRLTISELVYAPPITNGAGDFTSFDTLYGPFLDGTALTGSGQLAGAEITSIMYAGDQVSSSYAAWATHAKANGWFDRVFDYTCDEPPNGCAWTDIPTRAAIVHGGDPLFRTLTTTTVQAAQANGVLSSLDILVPIINEMYGSSEDPYPGDQRAQYDTFLMGGNARLWMYQSCEPSSSCSPGSVGGSPGWPTMFIDEPALTNRIMQWMDFKYQVSAELYYETTYAMEEGDAWSTQYYFGNNGDGSIWYPGKPSVIGGTHDIPVESFRMKMLREGMQDYEYLNLLVKLGDSAFAQMELGKVVTAANSFTSDAGVLDQARLDMAAEIEKDLATSSDAGAPGQDGGASGHDAGAKDGGTGRHDGGPKGSDAGGPKTTPTEAGAAADASGADGGAPGKGGSGCSCRAAPRESSSGGVGVAVATIALILGRRRRS